MSILLPGLSWSSEKYLKSLSIILVMVFLINIIPAYSDTSDLTYSELNQVFTKVRNAERAGADVKNLIGDLDSAALLLNEGGEDNINQANLLISKVKFLIPIVDEQFSRVNYVNSIYIVISLAILTILGIIVWVYGSKFYWGLWLRIYENWRIEKP